MFKYSLQSGSKKTHCPKCGKKRFVPYINNQTKEILHHTVGRCDREVNCGYHLTPKQYQSTELTCTERSRSISGSVPVYQKPTFHLTSYIKKSLKKTDNFTTYLRTIFNPQEVNQIIKTYKISTSTHWNNATIFWQIDNQNRVRAGKVILYDNTGHRSKYATWIHSILLKKKVITTYHLNQCLFGLHLINTNAKPIAIVESEKTACILSIKFPKYCWLATGGSNNIADKFFTPIKSRKIILFPDLSIDNSIFEKWNQKALELQKFGFDITTSTLLENIATENDKQNGFDIADFVISAQAEISAFSPIVKIITKNECDIRPKEDDGVVTHKTSIIHKNNESESKNSSPIISPLRGDACKAEGSTLPFGTNGMISERQMGRILTKPQQTLKKLITKNPQLKYLIDIFDLEINESSKI